MFFLILITLALIHIVVSCRRNLMAIRDQRPSDDYDYGDQILRKFDFDERYSKVDNLIELVWVILFFIQFFDLNLYARVYYGLTVLINLKSAHALWNLPDDL